MIIIPRGFQVDRLLLELKLPPMDAYFKLLHTVEEVRVSVLSLAISRDVCFPRYIYMSEVFE